MSLNFRLLLFKKYLKTFTYPIEASELAQEFLFGGLVICRLVVALLFSPRSNIRFSAGARSAIVSLVYICSIYCCSQDEIIEIFLSFHISSSMLDALLLFRHLDLLKRQYFLKLFSKLILLQT